MAGDGRQIESVPIQKFAYAPAFGRIQRIQFRGVAVDDGELDAVETQVGQVFQRCVDGQHGHAPGGVTEFHSDPSIQALSRMSSISC